ncbi:MAG: hypothetical protein HOP28_03110 [Gemmatimonadales bacterium]|nr:hypothetical protein [Gemmatimonadales bacterium]
MKCSTALLVANALLALAAGTTAQAQTPAAASVPSRQGDLQHFRTEFMARDRSFSAAARAEAESRLRHLDSTAATLSAAAFELELARIVALADNGHTAARASPRSSRYNRVPVRLTPFGDHFFVLRTDSANADLLGARLVAIDGKAVAEAIAVGRTLAGGTAGWRDRSVAYFLESPEQMHALGLAAQVGRATYRFELPGGAMVERGIGGQAPGPNRDRLPAGRWLYPHPLDPEFGTGKTLLTSEQAAWAFQEYEMPFRWRDAPEIDGMVVQFRMNRDAPGRPIKEFLDEVRKEIRARHPRNLVIDLRMDSGGDLNTTRDFVRALPTLVPGQIYALTSPWTFSAGISTLGYLEQASPGRVTIVGEGVGDRMEFWAEGDLIELPFSRAVIGYSPERHDYKTGCKPYRDCHQAVVRNPIGVPSLDPNLIAPWTIDAYRTGRDPGIEAIVAALGKPRT